MEGQPFANAESSPGKTTTAQVTPDWTAERDAGHVWSALSQIRQEAGEMRAAINANTAATRDVRGDLKDLDKGLQDLKSQTQSHLSFVKGAVWFAGIGFAVASGLFIWAWSSIIQPGLAHAIVEQVRPELSKQVNEAVRAANPPTGKRP